MSKNMKFASFFVSVSLAFPLFLGGCMLQNAPKTVRLAFTDRVKAIDFSVDGKNRKQVATDQITNRIERIQIQQGDVVVMERPDDASPDVVNALMGWLIEFCETNRAALYIQPRLPAKKDIFSCSIYHWVCPYEDPRNMSMAKFYLEGHLLGNGQLGFERMLNSLRMRRLPIVFILGSRHDSNRGYAPWDSPYANQEKVLEEVLSSSKTTLLNPSIAHY